MSVRFYNPGHRKQQTLTFDHPTNDPRQQNLISYYHFDAPERAFFDVRTEIEVPGDGGPINVAVRFAETIQTTYRKYGMVRIDPNRANIHEEENIANDEKGARLKGDRFWREYMEAMAREHIMNVEQAYAVGGIPQRARGDYKHALDFLRMEDPADKVGTAISRTQDSGELAELRRQVAELTAMVTTPAKAGK